jgi:tRNA nucleotidyltransferase (CCA-adding enzyme)
MRLVTTHPNADLDAFGAMVALRLLHPDLVAWFPGTREVTLRTLLASGLYELPEAGSRDLERPELEQVFLVDADGLDRLGPLRPIILERRLPLTVYDHHAPSATLPPWARVHTRACGSASTLLTLELLERGVAIPSLEASLILMGIFEDTGHFRFLETTAEDFRAAAALLEAGADLALVRRFLVQELNADQLGVLDAFHAGREGHSIRGYRATLAPVSLRRYVEDIAFVVHRYVEMMGEDLFVALVEQEGKITLIGRNRHPRVDLGAVFRALGGGGHPGAASAILRDCTLVEARARVLRALGDGLPPRARAGDVMTRPVFTVPPGSSVREALEEMNRRHINAVPVVEGGRVLGAATRLMVDKALAHGLGAAPVEDIVEGGVPEVPPSTPLEDLREMILKRGRRFVLVRDEGGVAGIITRMDLYRNLLGRAEEEPSRFAPRSVEFRRPLEHQLPREALDRLREVGRRAEALGMQAYLVGGTVRDLVLNRPVEDLDVVVEGEGIRLGEALGETLGARFRAHAKFLTGVLVFQDGMRIDIATARRESYARPGALPDVEASPLAHDLARRDFTVNTLVVALNPDQWGKMLDFFGGMQDFKNRVIRALHSLSFIEDPTRAYRAVRLAERLGFKLSSDTEKLVRAALKHRAFDALSGHRLWEEFAALLRLPDPRRAIERLDALGLLEPVHPDLVLTAGARDLLSAAEEVLHWARIEAVRTEPHELFTLLCLLHGLEESALPEVGRRLGFEGGRRALVDGHRQVARQLAAELFRADLPSQVYGVLRGAGLPFVIWTMIASHDPVVRDKLKLYLTRLRGVRLRVRGRDLVARGAPPGPAVAGALEKTLLAAMDGQLQSRDEELEFALRCLGLPR